MEQQLIASIQAIGIIQPPVVRTVEGELVVKAGDRRVKAAIAAGLPVIDVLVKDGDDNVVPMESLSENLIRASMNSVDIWRAVESLEQQNWNEQAIANALALPVRTIKRLKLLAHLHPPMLDAMARGDMPSEEHLRIIAAATQEEQAQVWKKHKPKKGEETAWWAVANALSKRRIPFSAAKFDEDLARAYGVEWHDDLFVPAGEDGRYTTNVDGFFGAQGEWLANNLPERGVVLTQDEYGQPILPKKAERAWGKPGKGDITGHYLDPRTAEVKTITYRMPAEKKPTKQDKNAPEPIDEASTKKARPDVTQKGDAMIGDMRTDALHEALAQNQIGDTTFIALLVLALAGRNVSVQSGIEEGTSDRETIRDTLIEGGVITTDGARIRAAARDMLTAVLSCRGNMSNSGIGARIAGETISAAAYLPSMATEEFLSCLSRQALEREAAANGVRVEARVKDTRARIIEHLAGATWHYPAALFTPTPDDLADIGPDADAGVDDGEGLRGDAEPYGETGSEEGAGDSEFGPEDEIGLADAAD
jgi:ParB/RepB/Spo0J family partition protein